MSQNAGGKHKSPHEYVLIPDNPHKFFLFSPGHIQCFPISHYHLPTFATDVFFPKRFVDKVRVIVLGYKEIFLPIHWESLAGYLDFLFQSPHLVADITTAADKGVPGLRPPDLACLQSSRSFSLSRHFLFRYTGCCWLVRDTESLNKCYIICVT